MANCDGTIVNVESRTPINEFLLSTFPENLLF